MRRCNLLGASLAAVFGLAWTGSARAQEGVPSFRQEGHFAIGAERLFGIVWTSMSTTTNVGGTDVTRTEKYTNVNLLMNASGLTYTTYSVPRLSFDYFVIDGLSVGGSLGYFHVSGSTKQENAGGSVTTDTGSGHAFLLAPRAGYALMFTPTLGIWPRGGFTFLFGGGEAADGYPKESSTAVALTIEVPFVFTPVPHVGFALAPTFDIGLTGSQKDTDLDAMGQEVTTKTDFTATDIGLQANLFVHF